nr:MAG TPA_asm: hypothetical protein [Caudoviricetes sp.]
MCSLKETYSVTSVACNIVQIMLIKRSCEQEFTYRL